LIEPREIHQISNQKDEDLLFIAVCVPAWSPADSFDIEEEA
jgi:mannose-6-phosphate isomerase-like protein (cupin superfamily)